MANLTHDGGLRVGRMPACASTPSRRAGWPRSGMDTYGGAMRTLIIPKLKAHVPLRRLATEAEISAAIVLPAVARRRRSSPASRCRSTAARRWAALCAGGGSQALRSLRRLSSGGDA